VAGQNWDPARARYQQLLDQYPGHELTARAQEGVRQATLALELANVRGLLAGPTGASPHTEPPVPPTDADVRGAFRPLITP
jgi:hypothetical protein